MTPNTFALESTEVLAIVFYELNKASDEQSITYRSCNSNQLLYFSREGAYGFTTAPHYFWNSNNITKQLDFGGSYIKVLGQHIY